MAGSESYIQVPADSTGKKTRTVTDTVGANVVHQEVISIADPTTLTQVAGVDASSQLKVVEASAAAIKTAVELIDNAVSGSELQVDVVAALPAGTNAIGKLAANTGVDIGDVDVLSVVPGVAATNLGKAEDAAHSSGDVGVQVLGVRNDTPTSRAGTDGDYTPVAVDEYGQVKVVVVNNWQKNVSTDWKYAAINTASSGDNTLVAAAGASNKIAVWSILLVSDGTVDARFEDGAGGTAFTGQIPLQAREGFTYNSGGNIPLFVGTANTLLNLELSAAVNVHGSLSYTVVT